MKALVTGGGGFVGRAIAERLLQRSHAVTVVGRSEYPELAALGAATRRADVADLGTLEAAVAGHDVVFHAAAKAGVWGAYEDFWRTNVVGTRNVIEACRRGGVGRLVYTSSPSVVFDGRDHENAGPELPYPARHLAHYPETKAEAERAVLSANGDELATVALRPHLIYGPRDPHIVPRLVERARRGRLRIVGDGRNRVSVTYVDNAAAAHLGAAERLAPAAECAGRAYFVADAEPVVLWEWINELLERVGVPGVTRRVSPRAAHLIGVACEGVWRGFRLPGEPPMTRFVAAQLGTTHTYDLEPARRDLGYVPEVDGADALGRTVDWWRATEAASASRPS